MKVKPLYTIAFFGVGSSMNWKYGSGGIEGAGIWAADARLQFKCKITVKTTVPSLQTMTNGEVSAADGAVHLEYIGRHLSKDHTVE